MPLFFHVLYFKAQKKIPKEKEKKLRWTNDFLFHGTHKLFSILCFLSQLYVKAPQIRNVFFVLAMKTQATRDALFVGCTSLLVVKKSNKTGELHPS